MIQKFSNNLLIVILILWHFFVYEQNATGKLFYAVDGQDFYIIDTNLGTATRVGPVGYNYLNGLAYDSEREVMYAAASERIGNTTLVTIDITTGMGTKFGEIPEYIGGLTFDNTRDVLWAISGASENPLFLFKIDSDTGDVIEKIEVVSPCYPEAQGLAYDSRRDILYAAMCTPTFALVKINPSTAQTEYVGPFGDDFMAVMGLDYDIQNDKLFGVNIGTLPPILSQFIEINIETGVAAAIGPSFAQLFSGTVTASFDESKNVELVGMLEDTAAVAIFVQGSYAYVVGGAYGYGLRVIDVSVPSHPTEVGFYNTNSQVCDVYIQDSYAYVVDGYSLSRGLHVIDISVPSNPKEVGFYDTPGYALGVYVQGNYAYVADGLNGLRVIDVSSPSNPMEVGFCEPPGFADDVYVSGGYAYVVDDLGGFNIIDVSVSSKPVEVGRTLTHSSYAHDVYVSGGYAYVAGSNYELCIIDVSSPSNPVEVGFYGTPGYASGVYVQSSYAYVAAGDEGLRVIDVSVPSNPREVGFYDTPDLAFGVYVSSGLAYVANGFDLYILRYTGGGPDTTPPSAITDLATSNPMPDSITLTWTAPGDDGDVGLASQYDIRYSTSPIDEGNWDSATQAVGEPKPKLPGSVENFVLKGLSPGTTYYFAIKTADEVPNWSGLSNVAKGTTQLVPPVLLSPPDGSEIDTPTVELKWGAVVGATSYTVQYSIDPTFPPVSQKTVTLTGLPTTNHTIPLQGIGAQVYWRVKGVKSGAESAWSEVWDFKATYAETVVTSAVIDRPADGSTFKQWTQTTARAYFTGAYEGEITGKWWLDGAPWGDFAVTMTKGKRTEVESPFLPTDAVGSAHNIQIKVETPSPLSSTIVTYNVVAGDWGAPAQLSIRSEPSIILTGGDTSTLTAIVKDAENRTVQSYNDIVTFAILVGPGVLQGNPVVTAQNGEAQIVLASMETAGLVRIEAQIPPDYNVPGAEVTVTTTDSDVQQYLDRIQEYIDRLKNLKIEVPGWPAVSLSESYDLSGVGEFLDTKIRPPNNPIPAEIEALKRLTFALEAIDHAYYHRFDPFKIDQDREVLGNMTIADDIMDSAAQILLVGLGAIAKIEGLAGDIPILGDIVRVVVREASKLILDIMEDVVNDAINKIPDEAIRNLLFMAMKSIYSALDAGINVGKSLTELLADVGIRLPADDLILSNYIEKYQYLIDKAVEFANNPDSITSTTKIAELAVDAQIENIRGKTDVTHEVIKTLQWNADIADTVGDIALATGIGAVVGIVTKVMAGIELGYGIVEGSITFYYDVPAYLENAVLLAFQPDKPIQTYQPPALIAHNRQGVKSPLPPFEKGGAGGDFPFFKGGKPDIVRYQRYLRMATTGESDFETILAQIVAAVEAGDTKAVKELLPLNDPSYPNLTLEIADVTGDGTVSALDAALVLQYTVGLIKEFPRSLTGAPALDAKVEPKLLTEAIGKLEAVPLDREGQQVLESLKRLIAKPLPPVHTVLFQNFPNPFNPDTWIPFELVKDANVTISIYNAKGQLIRTLSLGNQKAGIYVSKDKAAYWDGRDNAGEKVASGVYFYTLQVEHQSRQGSDKLHSDENKVGSFRMTRKMVILK